MYQRHVRLGASRRTFFGKELAGGVGLAFKYTFGGVEERVRAGRGRRASVVVRIIRACATCSYREFVSNARCGTRGWIPINPMSRILRRSLNSSVRYPIVRVSECPSANWVHRGEGSLPPASIAVLEVALARDVRLVYEVFGQDLEWSVLAADGGPTSRGCQWCASAGQGDVYAPMNAAKYPLTMSTLVGQGSFDAL